MEEKMIKEFDRSIEQIMNQHAVAPPFGAWNRIAAELDKTVPSAPPVAPRIPKSAWIGFVSGASLIATLVGGALIYNNYSSQPKITFPIEGIVVESVVAQPMPKVVIAKSIEVPSVEKTPMAAKVSIAEKQIENSTIVIESVPQQKNELAENKSSELTSEWPEKVEKTYFFPAVDINTGNEYDESIVQYAMPSEHGSIATHQNEGEKKVKSNNVREIRFKPRKDRKRPHNYGRYNRLK